MSPPNELQLDFSWNTPRSCVPEVPITKVATECIGEQVCSLGVVMVVVPLPFGAYRISADYDIEYLLDFYIDLESLSRGDIAMADCVLGDGGLRFAVVKDDIYSEFVISVMPALDGRFLTSFSVRLETASLLSVWRTFASQIVNYASRSKSSSIVP